MTDAIKAKIRETQKAKWSDPERRAAQAERIKKAFADKRSHILDGTAAQLVNKPE
jgi:hypothetical protein